MLDSLNLSEYTNDAKAMSALRIISKWVTRYPKRLDIVYVLVFNETYDTRSKAKLNVFNQWLEQNSMYNHIIESAKLSMKEGGR